MINNTLFPSQKCSLGDKLYIIQQIGEHFG